MSTTNPTPASPSVLMHDTVVGRVLSHLVHQEPSTLMRILLIVALGLLVAVAVRFTRRFSEWLVHRSRMQKAPRVLAARQPKLATLTRLVSSAIVFCIYFFAIGFLLQELGVNLTTYLVSASVVGLAISFGSQGLVQDVVIGLTLVFSDTMDVDDLVEVAGIATVIGRVEEIGLRFTRLVNFHGQVILIPNRTIANVSRFPRGGVNTIVDIQIPAAANRAQARQTVTNVAQGIRGQFRAIVLSEPAVGDIETAQGGAWSFLRVQFKIWPGQGGLIETTLRQQLVSAMKAFDTQYADWQVAVTYHAAVEA